MPNQNNNQETMPSAASVMPAADTTQENSPVPVNVQTGNPDLIDDVSDGTSATLNNAGASENSGVTNLSDAKAAFARLLAAATQQGEAAGATEPAPQTNANPTVSEAIERPVAEQTSPNEAQNGVAAAKQPAFEPISKDALREVLQEEIQRAIANGEVPVASREDMAADMAGTESAESLSNEKPSFNMPDITSDEFYSKVSDDPGAAIMEVAEAIAGQKVAELQDRLKPLLEQSERVEKNHRVQDAIKQFSDRGYEDFGKYRESMVDYLKQGNFDMEDPNAYELAYNRAKATELQGLNEQLNQKLIESQSQGRALVDYMHDPESVSQMAQNEDVKKAVIDEYLRGLSTGGKPRIISDNTSNNPSGIAPNSPKTFREAGELFKRML